MNKERIELIDSHAHLDGKDFANDLEEVIERAQKADISTIINIGATDGFLGAERSLKLAEQYDMIWCTVGIHPHDARQPSDLARLKELAQHPKVRAIGETGLDFFKEWSPKEDQYRWFRLQVELAHELQLPIIIHSRDAAEECLTVLTEMEAERVGGVFHCFAESADFAARLHKCNFMVSFPGILTFPKAFAIHEAATQIPLEQIMLETDSPYLAPVPFRGKRCESAYVRHTAQHLATLKNESLETIAQITTKNARRFYKLPEVNKQ